MAHCDKMFLVEIICPVLLSRMIFFERNRLLLLILQSAHFNFQKNIYKNY